MQNIDRVSWQLLQDMTCLKMEQVRICLRHFISGKPADLFDELHPDWLPTQNLGYSKKEQEKICRSVNIGIKGRRQGFLGLIERSTQHIGSKLH